MTYADLLALAEYVTGMGPERIADTDADAVVRVLAEVAAAPDAVTAAAVLLRGMTRPRTEDPMSELTPDAHDALGHARAEARLLGHSDVGTEHLLLGLLHSDLAGLSDVNADRARAEAERLIGRGDCGAGDPIPFTPRSKRVLDLAESEANALGAAEVDVRHLLLGLIAEGEGIGPQVLTALGHRLRELRERVLAA